MRRARVGVIGAGWWATEQLNDKIEEEIYPAHLPSRSFVDLILGDAENMAPGRFGAYTVEFLNAAYMSAASGEPVKTASLDR